MHPKGLRIQPLWFSAFFLAATITVVLLNLSLWYLFVACALPFSFWILQHPRMLFYTLVIAVPPSVEFAISDSLATDLPDEPLMILCSFLFIALAIAKHNQKLGTPSSIILVLLSQVVWLMITVATSSDTLVSIKFLAAKMWYLAAFAGLPLLLLTEKRHIRRAVVLFTGSMLLCTLWVMAQHALNGFSFAAINDSVQPFFRNHVNYSVVLVCIIPILFAGIAYGKKGWKSGLCMLLVFTLVALYFSFARGAWLALVIGGISFWLLEKRLLFLGFATAVLISGAAVFFLAQSNKYEQYAPDYSTTIFHTNFSEHWAATYQMKDLSNAERIHRWVAGARMVGDYWKTGLGPSTFYPAYKEYTTPAFKTWVSDNPERSTVHNYFLLTLIEQGVPGLVLLLVLLGVAFYTVQKVYHRTADVFWRVAVSVSGVILAQLCTLNFLSDLVETDKGGSLFYLSLTVIAICDVKTRGLQLTPNIQGISKPIS